MIIYNVSFPGKTSGTVHIEYEKKRPHYTVAHPLFRSDKNIHKFGNFQSNRRTSLSQIWNLPAKVLVVRYGTSTVRGCRTDSLL